MTHDPNRPTGSVPPERDRTLGGATPPPEHRGPNRGDGGNSAMALIVGALAVALIIGAFFWFAGDTQDTATLDDPAVTEEEMGTTEEPMTGQDTTLGTTDEEFVEEDTDVTVVEPTEDERRSSTRPSRTRPGRPRPRTRTSSTRPSSSN
jgi:hypothetical protein